MKLDVKMPDFLIVGDEDKAVRGFLKKMASKSGDKVSDIVGTVTFRKVARLCATVVHRGYMGEPRCMENVERSYDPSEVGDACCTYTVDDDGVVCQKICVHNFGGIPRVSVIDVDITEMLYFFEPFVTRNIRKKLT
jgi:hypothetical protein